MRPTVRCMQILHQLPRGARQQTVGFIGLGRMGSEMAFNLFSKTFAASRESRFVICDAVPDASAAFCENFRTQFPGASIDVSATPAEVVRASGTVITMLPSSPQVRTVYAGASGILSGLHDLPQETAQTLCIDSTTLDVEVAREVASEVIGSGAEMVDAPVSGGVTGAKAGTLSFLCGGTESAFTSASATLSLMGARIIHCGPSGSGLAAKIMNNLILGVHQIVVAEAMLLGSQKLGLDPAVLANVINTSTGACWASSVNNPVPTALLDKSPPCERGFEGGFATSLMLKDMRLATELAKKHGSPLPLGEAAESLYADALETDPELARKDFSSVYQFLAQRASLPSK